MPELPEVEVTRLSFADRIAGARIVSARVGKPLRWPLGADPAVLSGRTVAGVRRRGKYLLVDLDRGLLLLHLGMSGSLRFAPDLPLPDKHDHFDLHTSRGVLRLHDPRRFGAVLLVQGDNDPRARKLLGPIGMEPLSDAFSAEALAQQLKGRTAPIKQVLLAGKVVTGVGNIYASEVLFRAGIHPQKPAGKLTHKQVWRLWQAIREVLQQAIEHGGSTLRDYVDAHGKTGYFQLQTMVYSRAGEPCRVCGCAIKTMKQGQRATYFCPACQKR